MASGCVLTERRRLYACLPVYEQGDETFRVDFIR